MGATTGIAWTDSTYNPWQGCTKIAGNLACKDCYAEAFDKRGGGGHWGHGARRRRMSEHSRNEPYRWQRQADKFFAEHGRNRRVFTLSMGDMFDNEVPQEWRSEQFGTMENCDRLEWQICTKRITNLPKMVPCSWRTSWGGHWPRNIGVLITVVTQAEADRDIPRLLSIKRDWGVPWVGISYEPAQEEVDFLPYIEGSSYRAALDWIIFGGKSGRNWNDGPFDPEWAAPIAEQCAWTGCAFFFKQVAAFRPTDDMIPERLRIRQFPKASNAKVAG